MWLLSYMSFHTQPIPYLLKFFRKLPLAGNGLGAPDKEGCVVGKLLSFVQS